MSNLFLMNSKVKKMLTEWFAILTDCLRMIINLPPKVTLFWDTSRVNILCCTQLSRRINNYYYFIQLPKKNYSFLLFLIIGHLMGRDLGMINSLISLYYPVNECCTLLSVSKNCRVLIQYFTCTFPSFTVYSYNILWISIKPFSHIVGKIQ